MPSLLHRASSRGFRDMDWLQTAHSFSFENFYDPDKMGFGLLRVLNDDVIEAGEGFESHPHHNMEIVTIPLSGKLAHKDNFGHERIVGPGDVQVMSAGTGIIHSEMNASTTEPLFLLQIWVETDERDHLPRYEDRSFSNTEKNVFQLLISPYEADGALTIHQLAFFFIGNFDEAHITRYTLRDAKHGLYIFVIEGEIEVDENTLGTRDALGIWQIKEVEFKIKQDSKVLLIEVPMA